MRAPRGQNLVLLSLTMLFLVLMVTMTIGLGLRVRQKQELQNIADAAAFSNAVVTARAYNNMALINRLEVSYWVALAADESLISWTSYSRAMPRAIGDAAKSLNDSNCMQRRSGSDRDKVTKFSNDVNTFVSNQVSAGWQSMDARAGEEAKAIQSAIAALRSELSDGVVTNNPGDLQNRLYGTIGTQRITERILDQARQNDITVIDTGAGQNPNTAAELSRQEMDCDYGSPGNPSLAGTDPAGSGLCLRGSWSRVMLMAAMGTRGSAFLTGRSMVPPMLMTELTRLDNNSDVRLVMSGKSGSAYWSASQSHGANPSGEIAWGDDHGTVQLAFGSCLSDPVEAQAFVRSTHIDDQSDEHMWTGSSPEADAHEDHTMGDCTPLCPSVWVRTIGFQPGTEADAWGQPKVIVALERNLNRPDRPFPWELHFKFPFSAVGDAAEWDGQGRRIHTRGSNNLNISKQTAVSTGIAYYHRRDHWDEFPNLLNPFWRATLAPLDVDNAPRDLNRSLSSQQYKWQRDAWNALRGAGYEALR